MKYNHTLTSKEFQEAVDKIWKSNIIIASFACASGFSKTIVYRPYDQVWTLEIKRKGEERTTKVFYKSKNVLEAYNNTMP